MSPDQPPSRIFTIIPAAGLSRRMGRPKLLLQLGGVSVISRLLDVLSETNITTTVVVCRNSDDDLIDELKRSTARVVTPEVDPPDMRASVEHAIDFIRREVTPHADDGWMLIPADHPVLSKQVVGRLITVWNERRPRILIPACDGRRGHPTLFRWELASLVRSIPPDRGLNHLVRELAEEVVELPIDDRSVVMDLDTPEDFERLLAEYDG